MRELNIVFGLLQNLCTTDIEAENAETSNFNAYVTRNSVLVFHALINPPYDLSDLK